ncbi:POTRA domain-containing protein [Granulicella sp. S156]|uniref:POTRA domain-containing protein n=1 Tax=Granulicella sp. S156 TaxID=1747224 RepID=UPI00131AF80E|nr:POTRA domain-containing protein [Granulicella sp. S156]
MPRLNLAAVALLVASVPAYAQYTSGKIIFKNPGKMAQADLEAAGGIHSGQKVTTANLQTVAQRLMDTGYFDDVGVGVEGPASALAVTFTLKPLDPQHLAATGFENFVWLTPEELTAVLHKAAPLFHDQLPDAGNQPDAINTALQEALAAKGVTATVIHETLEPSTSQPLRVVEYRVEHPGVRIHGIALQGISPAMSSDMEKLAQKLRGTRYNEGLAGVTTAGVLLQPYHNAGYLEAKLKNVSQTLSQPEPSIVDVDLTATVDEGEPYHVGTLAFAGTPIIASDAVLSTAKLHPGDVASRKLLLDTLAPIDIAYKRQGYMDVFVEPSASLDTAAHTVSYNITVVPGEQYHLRSVTPLNLSPTAQKDFDTGWRMKPGDLYNAEYITSFLKNNTALQALNGYSAGFKASADPQTHLVDLTITFVRGAGAR